MEVPLLNFVGGPGVSLLNFVGDPGVPLLNFRGIPGPIFKLSGGFHVPLLNFEGCSRSQVPWSRVLGSRPYFYTMPTRKMSTYCL